MFICFGCLLIAVDVHYQFFLILAVHSSKSLSMNFHRFYLLHLLYPFICIHIRSSLSSMLLHCFKRLIGTHFLYLMYSYKDGDRLSLEDQKFVLENIFEYHPNKASKISDSLDFLMVRESLFLYLKFLIYHGKLDFFIIQK